MNMPNTRINLPPGLLVLCSLWMGFDSTARAGGTGFSCDKDGAARYVTVTHDAGYACRVKYVKPTGTSYPWTARNDAEYCLPRALGLVDKLQTLGWQCDSDAEVHSVLSARLEQYQRFLKILANVGKACEFYPGEARFGDLCGDQRDEAVIVYTCEAEAGAWDQHLAVFLEIQDEPLITEIGNSGSRQVVTYFIEQRKILLQTEDLDPAGQTEASAPAAQQAWVRCHSGESGWELVEE